MGGGLTGWGFTTTTAINTYGNAVSIDVSRAINGSGWVPVDLTGISSGAPIGSLPIDPTNKGGNVYIYAASTTAYKLSTKMESQKYGTGGTADVQTNDGGNNVNAYEQGSNLSL
jgi:hypothetical protein